MPSPPTRLNTASSPKAALKTTAGAYRRFNRALQLSTHAWHKPGTMRLFGRRHYRIIEIRGGEGDRRVSAGLTIVIADWRVGDGAFPEAV
jgi:hypothetical protein